MSYQLLTLTYSQANGKCRQVILKADSMNINIRIRHNYVDMRIVCNTMTQVITINN